MKKLILLMSLLLMVSVGSQAELKGLYAEISGGANEQVKIEIEKESNRVIAYRVSINRNELSTEESKASCVVVKEPLSYQLKSILEENVLFLKTAYWPEPSFSPAPTGVFLGMKVQYTYRGDLEEKESHIEYFSINGKLVEAYDLAKSIFSQIQGGNYSGETCQ